MKNESGERLDENGYAPSVVDGGIPMCYLCHSRGELVRHEIFCGPYRQKSKALGLWVHLCPTCHYKVHNGDHEEDRKLKSIGQARAMVFYDWTLDQWRERFGKNYRG